MSPYVSKLRPRSARSRVTKRWIVTFETQGISQRAVRFKTQRDDAPGAPWRGDELGTFETHGTSYARALVHCDISPHPQRTASNPLIDKSKSKSEFIWYSLAVSVTHDAYRVHIVQLSLDYR